MIIARGLTKRYGHDVAVQDLNFTVRPGVVTGCRCKEWARCWRLRAVVLNYLPENIMFNSLASIRPLHGGLSAWAGFAVLCVYAAGALAVGGWALLRLDA